MRASEYRRYHGQLSDHFLIPGDLLRERCKSQRVDSTAAAARWNQCQRFDSTALQALVIYFSFRRQIVQSSEPYRRAAQNRVGNPGSLAQREFTMGGQLFNSF